MFDVCMSDAAEGNSLHVRLVVAAAWSRKCCARSRMIARAIAPRVLQRIGPPVHRLAGFAIRAAAEIAMGKMP
jgi:hypothetical protein